MPSWIGGFSVAAEVTRPVINRVLEIFLDALRAQGQHTFSRRLGAFGSVQAELQRLELLDMEDPAPVGGVVTDVQATAEVRLQLLRFFNYTTQLIFRIDNVEVNLSKTAAGLPRGVVLSITPRLAVSVSFLPARGLFGWVLNRFVGPLVSFGVWLGFRLIRRVEIPIWDLVDVFNVLGIRYAPNSPLLTAQNLTPPNSLLLASDFNLTGGPVGTPGQLAHFIPASSNIGAVIHERVLSAAVQIAYAKGWVPTRFRVGKWKIYIRSINVEFEQDTIIASGTLKAKRKKCWCKVKVKITFRAEVEPWVANAGTPQVSIDYRYRANVNTHVSTSGMLVVLGAIMFPGVFLALTIAMSFLINIVLDQFLPFTTSWTTSGNQMTITATSVHFSGFVPFSMNFPLQLTGQGRYDISRFRQFQLPGGAQVNVDFKNDSLALQTDEFLVAVELS